MKLSTLKIRLLITVALLVSALFGLFVWFETRQRIVTGAGFSVSQLLLAQLAIGIPLAILITWLVLQRFTLPLQRFTEHVRHQEGLAELQPFPLTGSPNSEIRILTSAFNHLVGTISAQARSREEHLHFLEILLETIPNPIFYKDADEFRYLGCNSAFEAYIGIPKNELIGRSVYDISPPELAVVYDRADRELLTTRGVQVYEAKVRYADASHHDVIFYKSVFFAKDGAPGGLIGIIVDISDRKATEEALLKSREELQQALTATAEAHARLADILNSAADGLIVCDDQRRVVLVNPIATQLLNLPAASLRDRSLLDLPLPEELRTALDEALNQLDTTDRAPFCEVSHALGTRTRVLQLRPSLRRNAAGEANGAVFLLRDVTRERELDHMKSEFISTAAHELRTPLTAVVGYAELLDVAEREGSFTSEERRDFIREILEKSERLERIIEDFLDISRIETGRKLQLHKEPCDPLALVERVVHHFVFHSSRHRFIVDPGTPPPQALLLDSARMTQVLENLLSNAVKYSPQGGTIRVVFAPTADGVRLCIIDQGIGMTPEQIERVFDKFYRADASNTAIGGLGLGMSIVRAIIEEHGGRVWVESLPRQGTTVCVELPYEQSQEAPAGQEIL